MYYSLTTKENVIIYLNSGVMRLSKTDLHFVSNLYYIITFGSKKLTKNQENLLNFIIEKYKKQLNKNQLNYMDLIKLPFAYTQIIPSSNEFTQTYIKVIDNKIFFRNPFNKKFLEYFRKQKHNYFIWDKENKLYISDFSTHSFKFICSVAKKFYSDVKLCEVSLKLLDDINHKSSYTYDPTLYKTGTHYYIAACNQPLYLATKNLELKLDMLTAKTLGEYGIKIHESLMNEELRFANSFNYECHINNYDKIIDWLIKINCDVIFFSKSFYKVIEKNIINTELQKNSVAIKTLSEYRYSDITLAHNYNYPVLLQFHTQSTAMKKSLYNIKKQIIFSVD